MSAYGEPTKKNLGGWTDKHHHFCVHCKTLGKDALNPKRGHPYARSFDGFRHECPICLQFWFSNEWCGDGVSKDPKFVYVPNAANSIVRGSKAIPIWKLPPHLRRV